jgi:hypothetical protein
MRLSGGWRSNTDRKNRARATRKPRVRWEVLGLQNPLAARLMTSMDDIRQQALSLASSELKQGTRSPMAERDSKATTHASDSNNKRRRVPIIDRQKS